ncbi:MAG: ABC transporter substrate-binding protein [Burkholderiales bacterium]|nr:ABC transporter substrate-binding protein [Anaerolineae bacterium]
MSHAVLFAQSEPDHLIVVVGSALGVSNTYIAEAEGYFAAQNIEIEHATVGSTTDAEAIALLLSGEVDVLQASWTPALFNAVERGAELKVVAVPTYNDPESCPYAGFAVAAGQAENFDMESLRTSPVAISNGIAQYYLDKWLMSGGMRLNDVMLENMTTSARLEALVSGTVTLSYLTEPLLSRGVTEFGIEVLVGFNEIVPDASLSVLLFGPNILNREDDVAVRYLTAYLQGARQFNEGPTERNVEILSPALEMEPELLQQICWIRFRENGLLNTDTALDYIDWLNEQGLLDAPLSVDEFYDPSYVEQAYERLIAMAAPEATATMAE